MYLLAYCMPGGIFMIYEDYMRNVLGNDYQQAQMSNWNSINNSYIYPQMQFENEFEYTKIISRHIYSNIIQW